MYNPTYTPLKGGHVAHTGARYTGSSNGQTGKDVGYCAVFLLFVVGVILGGIALGAYNENTNLLPKSDESIRNSNYNSNSTKSQLLKDNQNTREKNDKEMLPLGIAGGVCLFVALVLGCCIRQGFICIN